MTAVRARASDRVSLDVLCSARAAIAKRKLASGSRTSLPPTRSRTRPLSSVDRGWLKVVVKPNACGSDVYESTPSLSGAVIPMGANDGKGGGSFRWRVKATEAAMASMSTTATRIAISRPSGSLNQVRVGIPFMTRRLKTTPFRPSSSAIFKNDLFIDGHLLFNNDFRSIGMLVGGSRSATEGSMVGFRGRAHAGGKGICLGLAQPPKR